MNIFLMKMFRFLGASILVFAFFFILSRPNGYFSKFFGETKFTKIQKLDSMKPWRALQLYNLQDQLLPTHLQSLFEQTITIAGFIIPNELDQSNRLQHFLLSPIPGGCVHVPLPPPNQIIDVQMKGDSTSPMFWNLIEVHGKLKLVETGHRPKYTYVLEADSVKEIKY